MSNVNLWRFQGIFKTCFAVIKLRNLFQKIWKCSKKVIWPTDWPTDQVTDQQTKWDACDSYRDHKNTSLWCMQLTVYMINGNEKG